MIGYIQNADLRLQADLAAHTLDQLDRAKVVRTPCEGQDLDERPAAVGDFRRRSSALTLLFHELLLARSLTAGATAPSFLPRARSTARSTQRTRLQQA